MRSKLSLKKHSLKVVSHQVKLIRVVRFCFKIPSNWFSIEFSQCFIRNVHLWILSKFYDIFNWFDFPSMVSVFIFDIGFYINFYFRFVLYFESTFAFTFNNFINNFVWPHNMFSNNHSFWETNWVDSMQTSIRAFIEFSLSDISSNWFLQSCSKSFSIIHTISDLNQNQFIFSSFLFSILFCKTWVVFCLFNINPIKPLFKVPSGFFV